MKQSFSALEPASHQHPFYEFQAQQAPLAKNGRQPEGCPYQSNSLSIADGATCSTPSQIEVESNTSFVFPSWMTIF